MIEEVLEYVAAFFMGSILLFLSVLACSCTALFILDIFDDIKEKMKKHDINDD